MTNKGDDKWLMRAAVETRIEKEQGRWVVSLMFIDTQDPNRFLIKRISDYRSKRLAEIHAENMKRTVERDPTGTKRISRDDFDINDN